jgi:homoserine dehydrogenase
VADIIDIARGRITPMFGLPADALEPLTDSPLSMHVGAYYLRLMVIDRPGVLASVARVLGEEAVSIESVLQRGRDPEEIVPLVLVTHDTEEAAMLRAVARIGEHDAVVEPPRLIRIETL